MQTQQNPILKSPKTATTTKKKKQKKGEEEEEESEGATSLSTLSASKFRFA
jgi:hypothetical protein